jgi:cytochrome P450
MRALSDAAIGSWVVGEPFSAHRAFQAITLSIILHIVLRRSPELRPRLHRMLTELLEMVSNAVVLRTTRGHLVDHVRTYKQAVWALIAVEIERRCKDASPRGEEGDVLDVLLAARDAKGERLTEAALRDNLITLLVAGHETTATALAWLLHDILSHQSVHDVLRTDIARVECETAAINELPFLDATVRESLRLHPVFLVTGRFVSVPTTLGTWTLPAGVVAAACIYLAHRRTATWPEPDRFRPERFLEHRPSPSEYLPFGGGLRRCVGATIALYEMKQIIACVLRRMNLRLWRPNTLSLRRSITIAPAAGVLIVAEPVRRSMWSKSVAE